MYRSLYYSREIVGVVREAGHRGFCEGRAQPPRTPLLCLTRRQSMFLHFILANWLFVLIENRRLSVISRIFRSFFNFFFLLLTMYRPWRNCRKSEQFFNKLLANFNRLAKTWHKAVVSFYKSMCRISANAPHMSIF